MSDYENAIGKWREFHQKDEPDKAYEIGEASKFWPKRWVYAGLATTCYYRSDKWEDDEKYNEYYHDHGQGIRCWHPPGVFPSGQRKRLLLKHKPTTLTVLGYSLGWDLVTQDGDELTYTHEKGEWLCCFPDGSVLVVVSGHGKLVALFEGQGLRVEDRGIVG